MALNANQKWTVGVGVAVVLCVLIIAILFQPHMPTSVSAAGVSVTSPATAAITPTAVQSTSATSVSPVVPAASAPDPTPTNIPQTPNKK